MSARHPDEQNRVNEIVQQTLARAARLPDSQITESCRMFDLGIDSVAMMSAVVMLEAPLTIRISEENLIRLFMAEDVAEVIVLASDMVRETHAV